MSEQLLKIVKKEIVDQDTIIKKEVVDSNVKPNIKNVKTENDKDGDVSNFFALTPMVVRGKLDLNANRKCVRMCDLATRKNKPRNKGIDGMASGPYKTSNKNCCHMNVQNNLVFAALEAAKTINEKRDDAGNVICSLMPSTMSEKGKRQKAWSPLETELFYKVLAYTGTDFSMMQEFISFRTRIECKSKFNKEERINLDKITKILANPNEFDNEVIEAEIAELKARALAQRLFKNP